MIYIQEKMWFDCFSISKKLSSKLNFIDFWSGHPSVWYIPLTSTQGPLLLRLKNPLLRQKSLRHVSYKNSSLRHVTWTTRDFDNPSFRHVIWTKTEKSEGLSKWRVEVTDFCGSDISKWPVEVKEFRAKK